MKNKGKYSVEELVEEPSFQSYVLKTSQEDTAWWTSYYLVNEDERETIEKAKLIIELLNQARNKSSPYKETDHKRLLDTIDLVDKVKLVFQPKVRQIISRRFKLAAIILLLLTLGAVGWSVYSGRFMHYSAESFSTSVGKGNKSKIVLSDGTEVWLNSESSLIYPSHFEKKKRVVTLVGEAYFKVRKDHNRQFIVNASEMRIHVYGTEFNIKSYPGEDQIYAVLVSGSMSVQKLSATGYSEPIMLKPSQKIVFYRAHHEELVAGNIPTHSSFSTDKSITKPGTKNSFDDIKKIEVISDVNLNNQIAWKDQRLIFRNESFAEIAKQFERWYDMEITFESDKIKSYKFTGVLEHETIEQALNAMRYASPATPFDYKIKNRTIQINEKK